MGTKIVVGAVVFAGLALWWLKKAAAEQPPKTQLPAGTPPQAPTFVLYGRAARKQLQNQPPAISGTREYPGINLCKGHLQNELFAKGKQFGIGPIPGEPFFTLGETYWLSVEGERILCQFLSWGSGSHIMKIIDRPQMSDWSIPKVPSYRDSSLATDYPQYAGKDPVIADATKYAFMQTNGLEWECQNRARVSGTNVGIDRCAVYVTEIRLPCEGSKAVPDSTLYPDFVPKTSPDGARCAKWDVLAMRCVPSTDDECAKAYQQRTRGQQAYEAQQAAAQAARSAAEEEACQSQYGISCDDYDRLVLWIDRTPPGSAEVTRRYNALSRIAFTVPADVADQRCLMTLPPTPSGQRAQPVGNEEVEHRRDRGETAYRSWNVVKRVEFQKDCYTLHKKGGSLLKCVGGFWGFAALWTPAGSTTARVSTTSTIRTGQIMRGFPWR